MVNSARGREMGGLGARRVASRGDRVGVCGARTEGVARCFVTFVGGGGGW